MQNMIIRGQVSSTNVQSFKKNLTHTEWKICQLQTVGSKNVHEKNLKLSHSLVEKSLVGILSYLLKMHSIKLEIYFKLCGKISNITSCRKPFLFSFF